ncbi:NAD(P)-dependent oxidoreductase [Saccharopolyspora indica]|uniref:NAD-dependent epimerase/dehydratase family protein n=1 Tax=Saccharopolyspora indica TaxID=1229659 RepID=UPI0022EA8E1C|nr:NAD(P)-dependent oxidoreductase [Saccharopolyspora indica]MDA3645732.1 NAD(P)-dependent oxidoreductase [Saccharopolyspora indica]
MSATRKVVVLGGTGFVGRHVCAAFAAAGSEVLAVARTPTSTDCRFISLSLDDVPAEALARLLEAEGADVVVNAVGSIWGAADRDMATRCLVPTQRLLAALALMRTRPRLVHLGSILEYGSDAQEESSGGTDRLPTRTAYGRAKLAATRAVLEAVTTGGVEGLVLRIANVAGPGTPEISLLGKVAQRLTEAALHDEAAVVELTPLKAHRDYVDVRDVAGAVVTAAAAEVTGRVIDIGSGEAVSVRDLVDLLIRASGVPTRIVEHPDESAAPEPQHWTRADIGPAREVLGWRPRRSLAEAVGDFWAETSGRPPVAMASTTSACSRVRTESGGAP